jgi:hypothetical protein
LQLPFLGTRHARLYHVQLIAGVLNVRIRDGARDISVKIVTPAAGNNRPLIRWAGRIPVQRPDGDLLGYAAGKKIGTDAHLERLVRRALIGGEARWEHGGDTCKGFGGGLLLAHVAFFLLAAQMGGRCDLSR